MAGHSGTIASHDPHRLSGTAQPRRLAVDEQRRNAWRVIAEMKGDDFFRPLWIRLAIVIACAGWAVLEWTSGETGWAMMAGAVAVYGVWSFLINYKPRE